jgi:hypothetical protein
MSLAETAIAETETLLAEIEPRIHANQGTHWFTGSSTEATEAKLRLLAAVERLAPGGSVHRTQAAEIAARRGYENAQVPALAGVLRALRADYADGYVRSVEELVHADVFDDFLEMAEELLSKSYKDAAAVIGGSVLETQLRKLAAKHGLTLHDPSGRQQTGGPLNDSLAKAGVYSKLTQKRLTAQLHIRNKAAHGEYSEYEAQDVQDLLASVREFCEQFPA